jgi:hypothetical protein
MITIGQGAFKTCSGITRRDFLRVGSLGLGSLGLSLSELNAGGADQWRDERAVILLMLVGGPGQLETWDPKPDAPSENRGPFGSIATRVPGVRISEHLPRLAARMDQVALIRSLHHDSAPIHETGLQLLQTGRICRIEDEHPHLGSVAGLLLGSRDRMPPSVILPRPIDNTGVKVPHGQTSGWLGPAFEPFHLDDDPASRSFSARKAMDRAERFLDRAGNCEIEGSQALAEAVEPVLRASRGSAFELDRERDDIRARYGLNTFGQSCLLARRLVERGVHVVTVNMFETVFNKVTWDCHGSAPFSSLDDYARELLPTLDLALSALLDDLRERRLLDSTLVVATGEFGRTPRLNATGGRDHWPGVWTGLAAGGGVRGGQVVGASDAEGSAPADRPVRPEELVATMYHCLGLSSARYLTRESDESFALVDGAQPISELFR